MRRRTGNMRVVSLLTCNKLQNRKHDDVPMKALAEEVLVGNAFF